MDGASACTILHLVSTEAAKCIKHNKKIPTNLPERAYFIPGHTHSKILAQNLGSRIGVQMHPEDLSLSLYSERCPVKMLDC